MSDEFIDLGSGFWNIQGTFRLGGILNIGTQCSLIQLSDTRFIFLDSYTLTGDIRDKVMQLTNKGEYVEAVLNLHPFHTVHCSQMAKDFPTAVFYGSKRHHQKVADVSWSDDLVESETVASRYPELEFSLPEGIYYISPNENIHAGSLLAFHLASKTLHVDDTFVTLPFDLLKKLLPEVLLHPTTKQALLPEPNSGEKYCNWVEDISIRWSNTKHMCAAHSDIVKFNEGDFKTTLDKTLSKARPKLLR